MTYKFDRYRNATRILARCLCSDLSRRKIPTSYGTIWLQQWQKTRNLMVEMRKHIRRSSTLPETHNNFVYREEISSFIKSSFNEPEGPDHRWLNKMNDNRESFNLNGLFLVLVNAYNLDSTVIGRHKLNIMFERVKLLQQWYPKLNIFGLQCGVQVNSARETQIIQTIMEEYVTFPILISNKEFVKKADDICYLLFEASTDVTDHMIYQKIDTELGILSRAIDKFNILRKDNMIVQNSNYDRTKELDALKEPSICSSFRNLLLYYPGCISADEDGNRLFISDSNHHRIIIANSEGKILDCIGSSPGFEDGEFESAKLLRPGASFYDIAENCLYVVDSENHAVRRADLEKRVLETIYPVTERKVSSVWNWLLVKIGLSREVYTEPEPFDLDLVKFPWHLVMLDDKDLLIINRSFETAWIMKMETGEIKEVLKDKSCILEACEHMAVEKVTLLKDIQGSWLQPSLDHSLSVGRVPYAGLISSVAKLHKNTFFCDSACHRVLKYDGESRSISYFQFSALGVLGLPYWLICPLERVSNTNREYLCKPWHEHLHYFTVLPGSCNIQVNIDIPKGTELAASLEEGSIWRQGRGSVVVLNGLEGEAASAEKVGIAQQWYDELDDLAFSKPEIESSLPDERCTDTGSEDMSKVHFNCPIDISPGTSEVVVSMVLYLKLQRGQDTGEAWRILDLGNPDGRKLGDDDARVRFLLKTYGDLRDVVFMKPLHLRIRLDCGDHPTAATTKETITVDSTIDVNLPLN